MLDNNASKTTERASSTMILVTDQGEPHDDLLNNAFNALLTVPGKEFYHNFSLEMMVWHRGTKVYAFKDLFEAAKTIYNNWVIINPLDEVDSKDSRSVALSTHLEELSKSALSEPGLVTCLSDEKKKGEPTIEKNNHIWH